MRSDVVKVTALSLVFAAFAVIDFSAAQMQPTATEAFHLRQECKSLADKKAEELLSINPDFQQLITSYSKSKYDLKSSRCYIEIFKSWRYGKQRESEMYVRQIYDGLTDDLLAYAQIQNGKKMGLIFDGAHVADVGKNLGWDDADNYITNMMKEER